MREVSLVVQKLPPANREILTVLIRHLSKVSVLHVCAVVIEEEWRQKQRQWSSRLFGGRIYWILSRTSYFALG